MTQEEKAKAYDNLIKRLKDFQFEHRFSAFSDTIEKYFPELVESEDEQIRKGLIQYFSTFTLNTFAGLEPKKILAWLEKQGEQKHIDKIQLGKKYKCIASPRYSTFMLGEVYKAKDEFLCSLMNLCYDCFEPIEDDEQKPDDKVESNFHFKVGQWIVTTGKCVYLITKINGFNVTLVDTNGYEYVFDASSLDDAHEWNIADAKDGDVLVDEDNNIGIYKEIEDICWHSYIYLGCDNCLYGFSTGGYHLQNNTKPATREQRDTLEKAMADVANAGYIFDFEKKKLRKLKFRVGDEIKTVNEEPLTITRIDCFGYWSDDLFICSFENSAKWELVGKLVDKNEPEFKIGDWIYHEISGNAFHINRIENYTYISDEGATISFGRQNDWRLWAIQDAKNGDVLLSPSTPEGDKECPFIFKEIDKNGIVRHHVALLQNKDLEISNDVSNVMGYANAGYHVPATKEQCNLLFAKMKEAGYEWDVEKKELKKIEQKHTPKHKVGDTIYYNSFGEVKSMIIANVVTDSSDNPMYEDENGSAVFEKDFVEQKPAWSDEDENNILFLTSIIEECFKDKEKITLYGDTVCANFTKENVIDRLKSLRPKSQWKPSNEQIMALRWALNNVPYNKHKEEISGLLDQIKDL